MRYLWFVLVMFSWSYYSYSANPSNYPVSLIPDSLKENAHSVVRCHSVNFEYTDQQNGIEKVTKVVTILDDKGDEEANFELTTGKFWELKKISGEIYDEYGKLIKKIKSSDILTSTFSPELASDAMANIYRVNQSVYPYTVKYEYEVRFKNGIILFPDFDPVEAFDQSVQQADYTLRIPSVVPFGVYAHRLDCAGKKNSSGLIDDYTWSVSGFKAVDKEPHMVSLDSITPFLRIKPEDFVMENSNGSQRTWSDFGLWEWNLIKDRDELPGSFVQQLQNMVVNVSSDREKVKILYEYLQKNTRYVSIQLGIGGWQPIAAVSVNKTGFGDCKGLSNYMRAMLKAAGINSYYTVIYSGYKKRFIEKFASMGQANHVILSVPLAKDTIPLECTSSHMPFGYVHEDIAGHDALLITPEGGKLYRLPDYPDTLSCTRRNLQICIDKNGKIRADVCDGYEMKNFEGMISFVKNKTRDDQVKAIQADYHLPSLSVGSVVCEEKHDSRPCITIKYDFNSETYTTKSGSRFFCPVNPLKNTHVVFSKRKRKYPIELRGGEIEYDTISIKLPDGMHIESCPGNISIIKSFGSFHSVVHHNDNMIQIVQKIQLKNGIYPATTNDELKAFMLAVNEAFDAQIVLTPIELSKQN